MEKSANFQGDTLFFSGFTEIFVFTTKHQPKAKMMISLVHALSMETSTFSLSTVQPWK